MLKKIFEPLFFLFSFLSFTATTYAKPWTSSTMEIFAFFSAISLFISAIQKDQKLFITPTLLFTLTIITTSIIFFFPQKTKEIENIWMIALYGIFIIIYSNSVLLKNEKFFTYFFFAIIFAGIFNSYAIFNQQFPLAGYDLGIWIAPYQESHGRPYGNFGQPNLAATFLLTCICSAIYLKKKKKIENSTLVIISLFFASALSLPSSKTSFLCLTALFAISILFKDKLSCAIYTLVASVIFIIKYSTPSYTRDLSAVDISTGRFDLWLTLIDALSQSPWLGYGALNTRVAHFQSRELDITPHGQVIGYAHNLLFDFIIWFGVLIGLFITCFFLFTILDFLKRNHKKPQHIYLILPILIHSQLEFPLYYANFLFIFILIINKDYKPKSYIKNKYLPYMISAIGIIILLNIATEYYSISQRFTELRFYNQNYVNSKKPNHFSPIALDATGGQYNYFLKDKITTEDELEKISSLTKSMPSLKNYILIINYLRESKNREEEINYWLKKANSSFSTQEMEMLKQ